MLAGDDADVLLMQSDRDPQFFFVEKNAHIHVTASDSECARSCGLIYSLAFER